MRRSALNLFARSEFFLSLFLVFFLVFFLFSKLLSRASLKMSTNTSGVATFYLNFGPQERKWNKKFVPWETLSYNFDRIKSWSLAEEIVSFYNPGDFSSALDHTYLISFVLTSKVVLWWIIPRLQAQITQNSVIRFREQTLLWHLCSIFSRWA